MPKPSWFAAAWRMSIEGWLKSLSETMEDGARTGTSNYSRCGCVGAVGCAQSSARITQSLSWGGENTICREACGFAESA